MNSTHKGYLCHVRFQLAQRWGVEGLTERMAQRAEEVLALAHLDLEPARAVLNRVYSQRRGGRRPRDPVAMLRALVLMAMLGVWSFNKWAAQLRREPELLVLCGFDVSEGAPGVATFYDFCNRLLDGEFRAGCEHEQRPSERLRGGRSGFRRNLSVEKAERKAATQAELAASQQGRVAQCAQRAAQRYAEQLPADFENVVERVLMLCGVVPSAKLGLHGDISQLDVMADGSVLPSQAQGDGHRLCSCRAEGQKNCRCDRLYADPDATWGYDSNAEDFYFGHRLHLAGTRHNGVELPVHLRVAGAHEADAVQATETFGRLPQLLREHLPEASIRSAILDKGYDARGLYEMLVGMNITPIIPLSVESKASTDAHGQKRAADGTPLCEAGIPMRFHGHNKRQNKNVFNCPAKRPGREDGKVVFRHHVQDCPLRALCEPDSVMGPLVHLSVGDDPRLNPPLPRGTDEFARRYAERTAVERIFSRMKAGGIGRRPYRRPHLFLIYALVQSLGMHGKARAALAGHKPKTPELWEAVFGELIAAQEESPLLAA